MHHVFNNTDDLQYFCQINFEILKKYVPFKKWFVQGTSIQAVIIKKSFGNDNEVIKKQVS